MERRGVKRRKEMRGKEWEEEERKKVGRGGEERGVEERREVGFIGKERRGKDK